MDIPQNPPERSRTGQGRYATEPMTAERDAAAARLKAQGKTYRQIAAEMGLQSHGIAWRAVQRCYAEVRKEAATELIAVESAELDRLYAHALELLEQDHQWVSQGKAVTAEDGSPLYDASPKIAAINALVKIRESFRKLHGLDQPGKQEISGGVKYEVVGVNPEDLT